MTLSICIPYHAGLERLGRCLASLRRNPPACEHQVIVVDDASAEPCSPLVQAEHPDARVVRIDVNVGFAGAVNRGLERARGTYVLILNPDTEVHAEAIDVLLDAISGAQDVGAVGPLLLNVDGTVQPQCKRGRLTPLTGLAYAVGLDRLCPNHPVLDGYLRRGEGYDEERDVRGLMGSCMMLRRSALDAVGGLDESMFLYGEDLDLSYRLCDAGWGVRFVPAARVTHVGGEGGTQVRYLRSQMHYHRSLQLLFRKHPPTRWYFAYDWLVGVGLWTRFGVMAAAHVVGRRRIGARRARGPASPVARTSP